MEERSSTNDFSGGRSPTIWSGSVSILKQFVSNAEDRKGDNPQCVKYGQNYVFAALVQQVSIISPNWTSLLTVTVVRV